jgi:polar amino acid transport system substrate-binding protein
VVISSFSLALVVLMFSLSMPAARALDSKLVVATKDTVPPFAFRNKSDLTGFSIELWSNIAKKLGKQYQWLPLKTTPEILQAVEAEKADLGIANISITSDREDKFDFSFPMFESGLQIMTLSRQQPAGLPYFFGLFFTSSLLQLFAWMALLVLLLSHVVWFFERGNKKTDISDSYIPGIFEACWWAAATLATQAESMPKSLLGRMLAVLWMFTSVVFVAYFTATVTSNLTVQNLQGDIKGPNDLPGKTVLTVKSSTAEKYLRKGGLSVVSYPSIDIAYKALLARKGDAIVYDSPVLVYLSSHEGKGLVTVVGSIFEKESYGIVFPQGSQLRKAVNEALLSLIESGYYQKLYDHWFQQSSHSNS